jgi:hypothetical protein
VTTPFLPSREELRFREAQKTLSNYREMIEGQLAQVPRDLSPEERAALQTQFEKLPDVRDAIINIRRANRLYEVEIAFPQVARRSLVVAVASAIEEQARVFCDALHTFRALPLRWNDLKGNTLDRLHTYAFKLAGLSAPPATLWERALWLHEIRNCIVHANGDVARSRDAKSLRAMVGKFAGYDIDAQGQILLHEAGGRLAVDVFTHLFTILYQEAKLPGTVLPNL